MKETVVLESKEVREIIANYLGIKIEDVIPQRYSFSVAGLSADEIKQKLKKV